MNKRINTRVLSSFIKQAISHNKYFEEREMRRRRLQIYDISDNKIKTHSDENITNFNQSESIRNEKKCKHKFNHKRKLDGDQITVKPKLEKNEKIENPDEKDNLKVDLKSHQDSNVRFKYRNDPVYAGMEKQKIYSNDQNQHLAKFKSVKKESNEDSDEFDELFLELYQYYNKKAVESWDHSGYMELYGQDSKKNKHIKKRKYTKKITEIKRSQFYSTSQSNEIGSNHKRKKK